LKKYKCLTQQEFSNGEYKLVPIRHEDRYEIMKWRNEQIYHLRQKEPLSVEQQDTYFENVVSKLFDQEQPNQILFSFLNNEELIGYGGLVHINWVDRNAEISLVMNTKLEENGFINIWVKYLMIVKLISFKILDLHKIYTYSFDLRPKLYEALRISLFKDEGRLKNHINVNQTYKDVLIHSLVNPIHTLSYRNAVASDMQLLLEWANDFDVRANAFNCEKISSESHELWFNNKLQKNESRILIFQNIQNLALGQVRIELKNNFWFIDYSVDKSLRGLGIGRLMIKQLVEDHKEYNFKGLVKNLNTASKKVFESLNFNKLEIENDVIEYSLNT
jgi:RimJ/RimL family protein N-acetyltransferase